MGGELGTEVPQPPGDAGTQSPERQGGGVHRELRALCLRIAMQGEDFLLSPPIGSGVRRGCRF